ncbi:MAG: TrkH family potassium uptake protein, partial [Bacteroidales bacterium]
MNNGKGFLDFRLILHFIGLTLLFESVFLLLDMIICMVYDHGSITAISESMLFTAIVGFILYVLTRTKVEENATIRDSFVIVVLSWMVLSLFGTLPFLFSHSIDSFTDAFFESVSGFTTTGSSILTDIEKVPRGILFWRSETHWIGGMGIIVLVLAVFPHYRVNAMQLFGAEVSTVVFEKLKPRLIQNVKRIWIIYLLLTFSETILLRIGGLDMLDSLSHAFGTVATGGFSTKNASIGGFSPYIQYVVLIFMVLAGINFALHYLVFTGNFKRVLKNEEFRFYLVLIIVIGLIVSVFLYVKFNYSVESSFRHSFFQVVSIITCTGYSTVDYQVWPHLLLFFLFLLMLIGGCAGSTSGGIKVVRVWITLKRIGLHIKQLIHPSMVKPLKYNGQPINADHVNVILSYVFIYIGLFVIGSFVMSLLG